MIAMLLLGQSDLGLSICTSGDCEFGRSRMTQMRQVFSQLVAAGKFPSTDWEPQIVALEDTFATTDDWTTSIPFSTTCCALRDFGLQAEQMIQKMYAAAGVQGPAATPVPSDPLDTLVTAAKWAGGIAIVGVAIYAGIKIYGAARVAKRA